MSDEHATPGHSTDTRRRLGIAPAELRVVVAVMSHEVVFGYGPTHAELRRFLGAAPKGYDLINRGWLRSKKVGPIAGHTLARWSSTELSRSVLGELRSERRTA